MLASNVGSTTSSSDNRLGSSSNDQVITKDADLSRAPCSELSISFPFGIFSGIVSVSKSKIRKRKLAKNELNASDSEIDEENSKFNQIKKAKKNLSSSRKNKPDPVVGTDQQSPNNSKKYKFIKARSLLDRAKNFKNKTSFKVSNTNTTNTLLDRRAIWQSEEDELILLM